MLLRIDRHSGVPLYRQMVEQIEHLIVSGQLVAGEQITPVRTLSQTLRLNPMTISKAYSALEQAGLLHRKPGIGLFIAEQPRNKKECERLLRKTLNDAVLTAKELGFGPKEIVRELNVVLEKTGVKK